MAKKLLAGYTKIKAAQKANEKALLKSIKEQNRLGIGYEFPTNSTVKMYNAIDRLVEAKKVVYKRRNIFSRQWKRNGYWITTKKKAS